MTTQTRNDSRHSTHMSLLRCENCDEVFVGEVMVHEPAGVAGVTCTECGRTHEPVRADVSAEVRTRVIAFVNGADHVAESDFDVVAGDDMKLAGEALVVGHARVGDFEFLADLASGIGGVPPLGDFEEGRGRGDVREFTVAFGGDGA